MHGFIKSQNGKFFLLVATALFIWFAFLVDVFTALFQSNYFIGFTIFVAGYMYIIMRFVFGMKPLSNPRVFVAWVIIFTVFDLILFPIMVGKTAQDPLSFGQSISSDVFIYRLMPTDWSQTMRYYMTYVVAPTIMLWIAYKLTGNKKNFAKAMKEAL